MPAFSSRQLIVLLLLTIVWGLNWPILKISVADFQPLTFRTVSLWLSLPVYALVLTWQRTGFAIARAHWPRVA